MTNLLFNFDFENLFSLFYCLVYSKSLLSFWVNSLSWIAETPIQSYENQSGMSSRVKTALQKQESWKNWRRVVLWRFNSIWRYEVKKTTEWKSKPRKNNRPRSDREFFYVFKSKSRPSMTHNESNFPGFEFTHNVISIWRSFAKLNPGLTNRLSHSPISRWQLPEASLMSMSKIASFHAHAYWTNSPVQVEPK